MKCVIYEHGELKSEITSLMYKKQFDDCYRGGSC